MVILLTSVERSPPIEEVIEAGVVPRFVEFLQREDYPQLQVTILDVFIVASLQLEEALLTCRLFFY